MAELLLNEWVWADLVDNANSARRDAAFELLTKIYETNDRLVLVRPSSFEKKAWALCKAATRPQREFAAYVKSNFLYNSERCLFVDAANFTHLAEPLATEVKVDDHYLVHAMLKHPDATLVTTDKPLIQILTRANMRVVHRDEFITAYLL